jgi:hypothetical protein
VLTAILALAIAALNPPTDSTRPSTPLTIPVGRHVLLDGKVRDEEWSDARVVPLASGARLLLKRDDAYLYVAIVPTGTRIFGVNLYIAQDERATEYLNLHASAKLGERVGHADAWPEWRWWNNHDWAANVARFNAFEGERFLPDERKEMQIALSRLPGTRFLLTLDLENPGQVEHPIETGVTADGLHWLEVQLAPKARTRKATDRRS